LQCPPEGAFIIMISEVPRPPQERKPLIELRRSVIPACDVSDLDSLEKIIKNTCEVPGIGGYKVGLSLAIPYGLIEVAKRIKEYTKLPIIYDHQKAGNDIPEMGSEFMKAIKKSGIEAAILFPFSSPVTEEEWIKSLQGEGLTVLVGGHMTHAKFLEGEGGLLLIRHLREYIQSQ
jgi:orotidine-5'-phosphate decarboxylase